MYEYIHTYMYLYIHVHTYVHIYRKQTKTEKNKISRNITFKITAINFSKWYITQYMFLLRYYLQTIYNTPEKLETK